MTLKHDGTSKSEDEADDDGGDDDDVIFVDIEPNSSSTSEDVKPAPIADQV